MSRPSILPRGRKFKKRHVAYSLVLIYIVMCQACMSMRFTRGETNRFFKKANIPYEDRNFVDRGRNLHYISTGDKDLPVLLFVHGSPGSWNAFKDYLADPRLLTKYQMIAIDRPGFGYSDFGEVSGLEAQANIINHFVRALRSSHPVTLVGHSYGGPLILQAAAMSPDLYDRLVVISGSVDPHAETAERWRPVVGSFPLKYLIPGALRPSNGELWLLKDDLFQLRFRLKHINKKVTIIHGDDDSLVPFSNAAYIEAELSGTETKLHVVKDAGHLIPWTHYEVIRDMLLTLE